MLDENIPEMHELERLRNELLTSNLSSPPSLDPPSPPFTSYSDLTNNRSMVLTQNQLDPLVFSNNLDYQLPTDQNPESSDVRPSRSSHFIVKIWYMVNDPNTDDLIRWAKAGSWFGIRDHVRFSEQILPLYFKHKNMNSFVRQLNLYGFRKVVHTRTRYETSPPPIEWSRLDGNQNVYVLEEGFAHPYFMRGCEHLLQHIRRRNGQYCGTLNNGNDNLSRSTAFKQNEEPVVINQHYPNRSMPTDLGKVEELYQVCQILKIQQEVQKKEMESLRRSKIALIGAVKELNDKYNKQQQVIQRLVTFLVNLLPRCEPTSDFVSWSQQPVTRPLMIECGDNATELSDTPHKRARLFDHEASLDLESKNIERVTSPLADDVDNFFAIDGRERFIWDI